MPVSEKSQPDPLSKTQRKNAMLELQKLGEALIDLSDSQLAQIPMDERLLAAIRTAHTLKTHESIRRHLQYIGKLMRKIDVEPIMAALKTIQYKRDQRTAQFHLTEEWRDRLIVEGDQAIQSLLVSYPEADRQHLRQLIRQAVRDRKANKNSGAETELFRYVRDLIGEDTTNNRGRG